jgi:hypothetical protein
MARLEERGDALERQQRLSEKVDFALLPQKHHA